MTRFRHLLPLLAILLGAACGGLAQAADLPPANRMLHQQGTRIVDGQAREVRLRGVNLGGWLIWEGWIFGKGILTSESTLMNHLTDLVGAPEALEFRRQVHDKFITEADIQQIAQAGFNCVRVPLNHRIFHDPGGWTVLDRLLGWCEKYQVYVVLDLHAAPGGQSGFGMADPGEDHRLLWASAENQARTVALWAALATRYRHRQIIAGYDLLNEPAPPSGSALVNLYQRISTAVRAQDPDHLMILEGAKFATDFSMFDKPLCANQAFSFHIYNWFGDDRPQKIAACQDCARKLQTPLWVGEFGENSYAMIRSTVELFDRCPEINGWAFWTWKKAPTTFPGLAVIKVPDHWLPVITSIGSLFGGSKPDPATARTGIKEFLAAMAFQNTIYDIRMEQALLPKPSRRGAQASSPP